MKANEMMPRGHRGSNVLSSILANSSASRTGIVGLLLSFAVIGLHRGQGAMTLREWLPALAVSIGVVAVTFAVIDVLKALGRGPRTDFGLIQLASFVIMAGATGASYLHGLVIASEHTSGYGHASMSPLEHALRDGSSQAIAFFLLGLLWMAWINRPAALRPRTRAGILLAISFVTPVIPLGLGMLDAASVPLATCGPNNAQRSYDVAAVSLFIPYSRWSNDGALPVEGPDGILHETDGDPNGMSFVLQQDKEAMINWAVPLNADPALDPAANRRLRPRPLVLRANVGDCVEITLTNELDPLNMGPFLPTVDPRVSMHAFGVSYAPNSGDGSAVGNNDDTTVGIGESITYYWRAPSSEGTYLFRDMGMPAGAAKDGGGAEHGLYGALAVEPAGSRWFDPISGAELSSSTPANQYASVATQNGDLYVQAVIALPGGQKFREAIMLSQDLIPVAVPAGLPGVERFSFNFGSEPEYKRIDFIPDWCADCVSEETVLSSWVYGDPGTVKLASDSGPWLPVQPEYGVDDNPTLSPGGLPATANVEDCGLMLTNDPGETRPLSCFTASVVQAYQGDPMKIRFGHAGVFETHVFHLHAHTWAAEPDDQGPAGTNPPKPTAANQPRATTVDSQTYSPWTAFTADLNYGAGARVGTIGDAIFHCHLYPHFSAGFWALLRTHDTHEDGNGASPDGTRVNSMVALRDIMGLNAPSVPPKKLAPTFANPGYPRFIPGQFGWRAPQPINSVWQRQFDANKEIVRDPSGKPVDTLATRIVAGQALDPALLSATQSFVNPTVEFSLQFAGQDTSVTLDLDPGKVRRVLGPVSTAADVEFALESLQAIDDVTVTGAGTSGDPFVVTLVLWRHVDDLTLTVLDPPTALIAAARATAATRPEAPTDVAPPTDAAPPSDGPADGTDPVSDAPVAAADVTAQAVTTATPSANFDPTDPVTSRIAHQLAVERTVTRTYNGGKDPVPGAPVVDPCPATARVVTYRASVIQLPIVYNNAGWVDVQGRMVVADEDVNAVLAGTKKPEPFFFRVNSGDCINFELTNRTPNQIGNDAYQELVQTNMVGSHIHLVNFDVLASDGSSNGWNYQQAAFTQDQAQFNAAVLAGDQDCLPVDLVAVPPVPGANCTVPLPDPLTYDPAVDSRDARANWLMNGQTIKERWYADYEVRTVFMHDHHFAGIMQNRGMFNALIVEPAGFDSRDPATGQWRQPLNNARLNPNNVPVAPCGAACNGTAYGAAMDLVGPAAGDDFREFGLAVHDFTPLIIPPVPGQPLTLPDIQDAANAIAPPLVPLKAPEDDQGAAAINYRNSPMKLRQFPPGVAPGLGAPGAPVNNPQDVVNPAYVFSSRVWGDPETPLLRAYRGDSVRVRLIQGSHEEQHNFTIHGSKWQRDALDPAAQYINTRAIGVSEAFNIDSKTMSCGPAVVSCITPPAGQPLVSDFLYGTTGIEDLWMGAWGVMRLFDQSRGSAIPGGTLGALPTLPDNSAARPVGTDLPTPGLQNLGAAPTTYERTLPKAPSNPTCVAGSTIKTFDVSAINMPIRYNRYQEADPYGLAYVPSADVAAIKAGTKDLEPLVLRANEGDCIIVNLKNEVNWTQFAVHGNQGTLDGDAWMPLEPIPVVPCVPTPAEPVCPPPFIGPNWVAGNRVSLHPQLVSYDVRSSDGATVGFNLDQTAGPNETVQYTWYADAVNYAGSGATVDDLTNGELGAIPLLGFGDVRGHRHHGLLAALVIGPPGATFHDPVSGSQVSTGAIVDVRVPGAATDYRDAVLFPTNGLNIRRGVGCTTLPLDAATCVDLVDPILGDWPDRGERAISYKNAPLHHRLRLDAPITNTNRLATDPLFSSPTFGTDLANVFSTTHIVGGAAIGDPDTPIVRAYAGDPVRIHVVQSADRARMLEFEVSGHSALDHAYDPGSIRSGVFGSMATGSVHTMHLNAAGGEMHQRGDYRYGVIHGVMGLSSGSWGILRVYDQPQTRPVTPTPIANPDTPFGAATPIRVLELPTITLTSPSDFAVLRPGAAPVPITASLTGSDGLPMGNTQLSFTSGVGAASTVTTNAAGQATWNLPVNGAARVVTVTVTGGGAEPATRTIELILPETTAPRVTALTPSGTGVDASSQIRISFSERVHPTTVTNTSIQIRRLSTTGPIVPSNVFLAPDRRSAVVVPQATLAESTRYFVVATNTVTDLVGNRMLANSNSFTTRDLTAPAQPTNVVAVGQRRAARVTWSRVTAGDLAGYYVYRNGVRMNVTPITTLTFNDTGLTPGVSYTYTITAIDRSGNESIASRPATAVALGP